MELVFCGGQELKIGGGPRVRSGWSAGGLQQKINKGESRRMTRRHGVDVAESAGKGKKGAQLDACWAKAVQ